MTAVVTAAQMRAMDQITIEDAGIAGVVLMENAGRGVAELARDVYADLDGGPVAVVCGRGNNGGDGFVIARCLSGWGIDTYCILVGARDGVGGDALTQLDAVDMLGIDVIELSESWNKDAEALLDAAPLIVDAILGTGLEAEVRGLARQVIDRINQAEAMIVAVDLPSGISSDTGWVMGRAVMADLTVTFALPKRGLLIHPGCDYAGELAVIDIGIPPDVIEHVDPGVYTNDDLTPPYLPPRLQDTHKGQYGNLLIIGGSPGKTGAVLLAGMAALRAGAGLVTILTDERSQAALEGRVPELMIQSGDVAAACEGRDVILIGPGLEGEGAKAAVAAALNSGVPVVADAGALDHLDPELPSPAVITPHPGEAARMLDVSTAKLQGNRFAGLAGLIEATGACVVLKGSKTLIAAPGDVAWINRNGNPGMATAGSGDVLAGIIAAFLPRLDVVDASRTAVYLHGLAGDRAAQRLGQESVIASDLIAELPHVLSPTED